MTHSSPMLHVGEPNQVGRKKRKVWYVHQRVPPHSLPLYLTCPSDPSNQDDNSPARRPFRLQHVPIVLCSFSEERDDNRYGQDRKAKGVAPGSDGESEREEHSNGPFSDSQRVTDSVENVVQP
jgi:hypothetical protein